MSEKIKYNGRLRILHTGTKGGKYVMVGGNKKYVKLIKNKSNKLKGGECLLSEWSKNIIKLIKEQNVNVIELNNNFYCKKINELESTGLIILSVELKINYNFNHKTIPLFLLFNAYYKNSNSIFSDGIESDKNGNLVLSLSKIYKFLNNLLFDKNKITVSRNNVNYIYKKKCDIKNIDIQIGDKFRVLQTDKCKKKYSCKYHFYIEIFNTKNNCIYTLGIITDSNNSNNIYNRLLNRKITFVIHDSFCSITTKQINRRYQNNKFDREYLLTNNKENAVGNYEDPVYIGEINQDHLNIINIIKKNGRYNEKTKSISYQSNLTYSILVKTTDNNRMFKEVDLSYLTFALACAYIFSNPILFPLIATFLHKIQSSMTYLTTFKEESELFNCIKISYLFFKNPKLLLEKIQKYHGTDPIYRNNNNNNTTNVFYNAETLLESKKLLENSKINKKQRNIISSALNKLNNTSRNYGSRNPETRYNSENNENNNNNNFHNAQSEFNNYLQNS